MAAPMVKQDLRCTEVAPLRPTIKGSLEPALEPTAVDAELALIITSWVPSVDGKELCVREGTLQMVRWDTVHK